MIPFICQQYSKKFDCGPSNLKFIFLTQKNTFESKIKNTLHQCNVTVLRALPWTPRRFFWHFLTYFWIIFLGYSQMGCTSKLVCAGTSIRRKTQSDSVWDHPSSGCCVAALAIHEVYPCGEIFFLTSWWLLSPPREWAWGLVWLSPECATVTVEDDAEYWWLVKNLSSIGWEGWEGCFGQHSLWLELYEIKGKSIFEAIGKT